MNARGGAHRGRAPRPGVSAVADNKQAEGVTSAASAADDGGESSTAIEALLSNRTSARLESVQRLLKHVITTAATVVRGTDSQRRFTSTYTDFCLSAVRCMADLEEAVFEHTHPGRRAADAADDEVAGITEEFFLKQVAGYVAAQTTSLSRAYLEHVALSSLEKQRQQQRKRERKASSTTSRTVGGQRAAKVSRKGGEQSGLAGRGSGEGGGAVVPAEGVGVDSAFDSLGLIDAQEIAREALHALEQGKATTAASSATSNGGGGGGGVEGRRRATQAATAVAGAGYTSSRLPGLYVSKAGGTTVDLRNPHVRLTAVPELATRLQPWLTPLVASGVFLDRVTMERERKGAASVTAAGAATSTTAPHTHPPAEPVETILDVCLSPKPAELLRHYEAREALVAAEPHSSAPGSSTSAVANSGGPFSVVPYAGRKGASHGGGSPRSTVASPASSPLMLSAGGRAEAVEGEAVADADPPAFSAFFPAVRENKPLTALPPYVIANQAHCGVSRMEFVYTMTPTPK